MKLTMLSHLAALICFSCVASALNSRYPNDHVTRRSFFENKGGFSSASFVGALVWQLGQQVANGADKADFETLVSQIKQARKQLDSVPALIDSEKWDSVRA